MALTDKLSAVGDAIRSKTGKTGKLSLSQMVTEILSIETCITEEETNVEYVKKEAIEKIVREIGRKSGLDRPLTPHLFRHTLATMLLQRGTPITEVQKILGHVDINTTTIYAKVSDEDVKTSHMKYAI